MTGLAFRRIAPDESRILLDGDRVGDVHALDDPLRPGKRQFILHLDEDPRGPRRVQDRGRVRELAERMVATHPLWG